MWESHEHSHVMVLQNMHGLTSYWRECPAYEQEMFLCTHNGQEGAIVTLHLVSKNLQI